MKEFARNNPLALLLGGLAAGFLVGLIVPGTKLESDTLGPIAGDLKNKASDAMAVAQRKAQSVIKDSIDAAQKAAVDSLNSQEA